MSFKLNNIVVEVVQKDIKNVHLSVYPPKGHVKVSAPESMAIETIRVYVISKLGWIKRQQEKLRTQEREAPRECIDRESHYFNGKRYLLKVVERDAPPRVSLSHSNIVLQVRPGADEFKKRVVLDMWYRQQLKEKVSRLISQWENKIDISVAQFTIRKMKTKWGSCSPLSRSIRINLELAKKPPEYLEYIIVHEMVHLHEPSHNSRFIALMDRFMPKWRLYRDELNTLPVRHEDWQY
ncbi:MAG TPA: M48 family peptidase [Gammaproteobacteria bacterium]|nr:M48 family peptidase [Gammaproteobacteria bacterium]